LWICGFILWIYFEFILWIYFEKIKCYLITIWITNQCGMFESYQLCVLGSYLGVDVVCGSFSGWLRVQDKAENDMVESNNKQ
jgi:hypothetical protein